jgi:hypothetical protein
LWAWAWKRLPSDPSSPTHTKRLGNLATEVRLLRILSKVN